MNCSAPLKAEELPIFVSWFNMSLLLLNSFCSTIIESSTGIAQIENQINITVVFPDDSLPTPTNGGFENQEEIS
jgi:hypothetical protein